MNPPIRYRSAPFFIKNIFNVEYSDKYIKFPRLRNCFKNSFDASKMFPSKLWEEMPEDM